MTLLFITHRYAFSQKVSRPMIRSLQVTVSGPSANRIALWITCIDEFLLRALFLSSSQPYSSTSNSQSIRYLLVYGEIFRSSVPRYFSTLFIHFVSLNLVYISLFQGD